MEWVSQHVSAGHLSSKHGPMRDHAVVKDASTVAKLNEQATRAQAYRSEEQKYNDKRQATGYQPQGPLAFNHYEVGRSSMPQHCHPTYQYKDKTERGMVVENPNFSTKAEIGDPGAYHPYTNTTGGFAWSEMNDRAGFTLNRDPKAFNSSEVRDIGKVRGISAGLDSPGAVYEISKHIFSIHPTINPIKSVFSSKSLNRPSAQSTTPGQGHYHPNFDSIDVNKRDAGATFRSTVTRQNPAFAGHPDHIGGTRASTPDTLGPGAYPLGDHYNTIGHNLEHLKKQQSSLKPGFGTIAPQRALPFEYSRSGPTAPDPGSYQPQVWTGKTMISKSAGASLSKKNKKVAKI